MTDPTKTITLSDGSKWEHKVGRMPAWKLMAHSPDEGEYEIEERQGEGAPYPYFHEPLCRKFMVATDYHAIAEVLDAHPALSGDTPAEPFAWRYRSAGSTNDADWCVDTAKPRFQYPERHEVEPLYLHPAPAVSADTPAKPVNQCDGCRRGMPLVHGVHRHTTETRKSAQDEGGASYPDMIGCTKDRYELPAKPVSWRDDPRCAASFERLADFMGDISYSPARVSELQKICAEIGDAVAALSGTPEGQ